MKKNTLIIILILGLLMNLGCARKTIDSESQTHSDETQHSPTELILENLTLKEVVSRSHFIGEVTIIEVMEQDDIIVYSCNVNKIYKGEDTGNAITIYENKGQYSFENSEQSFTSDKGRYSVGNCYIMMAEMIDSVYFDQPNYVLQNLYRADIAKGRKIVFIRETDEQKVLDVSEVEFERYLESIPDTSVKTASYVKSDDLHVIVDASEIVVTAKVECVEIEAPNSNRDTYLCTVTKTWKGNTDEKILIVLLKGTIKIGEEYIFLINRVSEQSLLYVLSAKEAVIRTDETDRVNIIQAKLG